MEVTYPLSIRGGAERDRTVDLLNAIQALSQLSYSPIQLKSNTLKNRLSKSLVPEVGISPILIVYKSIGCKSQFGIAWVILDYFRFRRSHFYQNKLQGAINSQNP